VLISGNFSEGGPRVFKKIGKTLLWVVIVCFSFVLFDRFLGLFLPFVYGKSGLTLFPPQSCSYYRTLEFNCLAAINSLGFRDREIGKDKEKNIRVVAIGDSFTYGWGVNLQDSWPKILEKNLQARGLSLEILNLGKPGASPVDYAEIAEIAIPLLRPDVLILAVLQGEDLWQLKTGYLDPPWTKDFLWEYLFPNLKKFRHAYRLWKAKGKVLTAEDTREDWIKTAQDMEHRLNHEEQTRFQRLNGPIKDAFMQGETSPYIIFHAVINPQMYRDTFDRESPTVKKLMDMLTQQFMNIKKLADRYKTKIIVCSVPSAVFVSENDYSFAEKLGFYLDKKMLELKNMDDIVRISSLKAELPDFLEVTDNFRSKCQKGRLYYLWDEHFNREGNKFFADSLTPYLMEFLTLHKLCGQTARRQFQDSPS